MRRIRPTTGTFEMTVTDLDGNEVDAEIAYSGYYDPGVCSGPIDNCYPPEGEVEIQSIIVAGKFISVEADEEHRIIEQCYADMECRE